MSSRVPTGLNDLLAPAAADADAEAFSAGLRSLDEQHYQVYQVVDGQHQSLAPLDDERLGWVD